MNTQNNSAQNLGNIETAEKLNLGAPETSTAFAVLFEAAAPYLSISELEYLARFDGQAKTQAESLSSSLMTLGCFFANAEKSCCPLKDETAEIIWNLSHQLDHIAGLIDVSSEAVFQLKKRREQNQQA